MATLGTIKFKGLTARTGNSAYLAGAGGLNVFQSTSTPYEATYQINFNNDSNPISFYPTQGDLTGSVAADGISYGGRYKITRLIYSLNQNVSIKYDNNLITITECPANYHLFQTNAMLNNFLNFNYTIPTPIFTITGFEAPLVFSPQAGTFGFIQFTINYFDKYIVSSGA